MTKVIELESTLMLYEKPLDQTMRLLKGKCAVKLHEIKIQVYEETGKLTRSI